MSEDSVPPAPSSAIAPDAVPLIFAWKRRRWGRSRLLLALAAAAALHMLLFYLFKVGNRSAMRRMPPAESVLLLSAADPAAASLLRTARDRLPGISPDFSLAGEDAAALRKLVKPYTPTWQDHTAALRPLPVQTTRTSLPSAIGSTALLLPPVPRQAPVASPPGAGVEPPAPAVEIAVLSGLTERPLLSTPAWPERPAEEDAGEAEYMIEVDASGKVLRCLPWNSTPRFDLRSPLLALQFTPAPGTRPQWAWISARW